MRADLDFVALIAEWLDLRAERDKLLNHAPHTDSSLSCNTVRFDAFWIKIGMSREEFFKILVDLGVVWPI